MALFLTMSSLAQDIQIGAKGGLDLTSMEFSSSSDILDESNRAGFFIGPTMRIGTPVMGLSVDVSALYDQRNIKVGTRTLTQECLVVPAHARLGVDVGDLLGIFICAGPQLNYNLGKSSFQWEDVDKYRKHYEMTPRMASFIATTNERQPLNDPTGSRRYLCVEVKGMIDTDTPINYQQLYAQALWELDQKQPYYFSKEEESAIEAHNALYQRMTPTDFLLSTYFEPTERDKRYFMRAVDILSELHCHATGADRPNIKQLTIALKAGHYRYGAQNGIRGWYARKR